MQPSSYEVGKRIYFIRGYEVMLDSDLALFFGVSVKRLNQLAKRNSVRFPKSFMFQLEKDEFAALRSQFVTSNIEANYLEINGFIADASQVNCLRSQIGTSNSNRGGRRHLPFVFTEQGVAMLSAILNTEQAIQVSITVMECFVRFRKERATRDTMAEQMGQLRSELSQKFEDQTRFILETIRQGSQHDSACV